MYSAVLPTLALLSLLGAIVPVSADAEQDFNLAISCRQQNNALFKGPAGDCRCDSPTASPGTGWSKCAAPTGDVQYGLSICLSSSTTGTSEAKCIIECSGEAELTADKKGCNLYPSAGGVTLETFLDNQAPTKYVGAYAYYQSGSGCAYARESDIVRDGGKVCKNEPRPENSVPACVWNVLLIVLLNVLLRSGWIKPPILVLPNPLVIRVVIKVVIREGTANRRNVFLHPIQPLPAQATSADATVVQLLPRPLLPSVNPLQVDTARQAARPLALLRRSVLSSVMPITSPPPTNLTVNLQLQPQPSQKTNVHQKKLDPRNRVVWTYVLRYLLLPTPETATMTCKHDAGLVNARCTVADCPSGNAPSTTNPLECASSDGTPGRLNGNTDCANGKDRLFHKALMSVYVLSGRFASRRWMGSLLVHEGYHPRQMFDCMFPSPWSNLITLWGSAVTHHSANALVMAPKDNHLSNYEAYLWRSVNFVSLKPKCSEELLATHWLRTPYSSVINHSGYPFF
ncbi:hypothetical protein BDZ94DRAFT_1302491 [Collybia nuda]|uniref:Uncharacterized protein n=1 Tax=Collybia nuda TaxID=64659 RepID=A0A9P6CCX5_9AGAR|nr:hypothetical protein BDZ94DRAFT_1302491 [Collybia nuda]